MLNSLLKLFLLFSISCSGTESASALPETQLGGYKPIIRKFQYAQLQGWIVKPAQVSQNTLFVFPVITQKAVDCFQNISKREPDTLFILTSVEQKENAERYLSQLNTNPTKIKELPCP